MRLYLRNAAYAARHPVRTYRVRKACREHVKAHPVCEWCGGTKGVEAHHVIPLWQDDSLAADPANFISLCRPKRCHLLVGHGGSYTHRYVKNVKAVCSLHTVVERENDTQISTGALVCVV